jgi:hypothetical protein
MNPHLKPQPSSAPGSQPLASAFTRTYLYTLHHHSLPSPPSPSRPLQPCRMQQSSSSPGRLFRTRIRTRKQAPPHEGAPPGRRLFPANPRHTAVCRVRRGALRSSSAAPASRREGRKPALLLAGLVGASRPGPRCCAGPGGGRGPPAGRSEGARANPARSACGHAHACGVGGARGGRRRRRGLGSDDFGTLKGRIGRPDRSTSPMIGDYRGTGMTSGHGPWAASSATHRGPPDRT